MSTGVAGPRPKSEPLNRVVEEIRAANRGAKAAPPGSPERRDRYRTKARLLSAVIARGDPGSYALRYHGRLTNGDALVLVTVFSATVRCFHTPLSRLGGTARGRVLDALGWPGPADQAPPNPGRRE